MEKIRNFWADLPAQRKKQLVLGTGCVILVSIMWQFLSGKEYERPDYVSPSSVQLTGDNTGELAMDALAARVRSMESSNNDLKRQLKNLEEEKQKAKDLEGEDGDGIQADYQRQIDRLHQRINRQTRALKNKGIEIDDEGNVSTTEEGDEFVESISLLNEDTDKSTPIDFGSTPSNGGARPNKDMSIWADKSRFQASSRQPGNQGGAEGNGEAGGGAPSPEVGITLIESTPDAATRERNELKEEEEEAGQFLPAGSIVSGTLITGLDAPTSNSAKGNPHPALVRIKTESILPNRYRADLRECFMIVSGYGDMSSERAYLRTETLSCINHNGEAMETSLESFAVGEDGKAGVRGRLVTKTGQLLAKSTMAAFISAASDVFGSSPVPTISTSASDAMPFQQALSDQSLQASAMKGTGKAMERIADYYMDMADQIFPILEVDAGREIDLILNKGASIKFGR